MKKETYLPLKILKKITEQYPKAWEQMEMFHNNNGAPDLGSWPDWCYTPMAAAVAVASKGNDDIIASTINNAQAIFALAPWRLNKEVYVIDEDLKKLLFEQEADLDVPDEILLHLPYPSFYVETPNTYFYNDKIHGFFVALEYDVNNGEKELKPVFVTEDGDVFSFSIHIGAKSIHESFDLLNKEAIENTRTPLEKELVFRSMQYSEENKKFLKQILQVILYILAQNAEITPSSEQAMYTRRGKTIKDKYSEIRKWDVGVRVGAAIRQQKAKEQSRQKEYKESEHQSPRPHMRRGHWHHFWTGPKTKPEERKLILKWLSPMTVAANPDDTPIVLHKVEL